MNSKCTNLFWGLCFFVDRLLGPGTRALNLAQGSDPGHGPAPIGGPGPGPRSWIHKKKQITKIKDFGTPYIYTTTGFGPRENKKMAGVCNFLVYMQNAPTDRSLYIHHHGGAAHPRGGVYRKFCILGQFSYTSTNGTHQPLPYFCQVQTRWWCNRVSL